MQRHASDAINYQQQISTGNKYSKASQDATALARGVEIQFDQSRYGMLKKNQDFISTRMAMADAQLGSIHDVLTSMQEIAVRARGPALGVPGLTAIAQQARQNYEHLKNLSVAMDTNDDRYLLRMTSEAQLSVPKTTETYGCRTWSGCIALTPCNSQSGGHIVVAPAALYPFAPRQRTSRIVIRATGSIVGIPIPVPAPLRDVPGDVIHAESVGHINSRRNLVAVVIAHP
jgi:hypothetical protein